MMCEGHLVESSITIEGDDGEWQHVIVRDVHPEVDGDVVDGTVFNVELSAETYASFDLEQARAFIEACQDILNRYDTV